MKNYLKHYSATSTSRFLECEQKFHYEYVQGYRSIGKGGGLKTGIIMHIAEEAYWRKETIDRAIDLAEKAAALEGWSQEDPLFMARIRAYIQGYYHRWAEQDKDTFLNPERYSILGWELEFEYMIDGNRFIGKMDAVLHDIDRDIILLVEHKNTSRKNSQDLSSSYYQILPMDTQLNIYADYLYKTYNLPVHVLYDVVTTSPATKPGGKKKIARRKSETNEEFQQRKIDNIESVDDFEKRMVHNYTNTPINFTRKEIPILGHTRDRKIAEIAQIVIQINELGRTERPPVRNTNSCSNYGGCEFFNCCIGTERVEESHKFTNIKEDR